jgi:hypothetical protein
MLPTDVRVTYWGGRGRCEPLRVILAAAGVTFTNVILTAESGKGELEKLRASGKLAYDQVPLIEIDGLNLVQSSATANYLGRKFDLLPNDAVEAYTVEGIWASCQVILPEDKLVIGQRQAHRPSCLLPLASFRTHVGHSSACPSSRTPSPSVPKSGRGP